MMNDIIDIFFAHKRLSLVPRGVASDGFEVEYHEFITRDEIVALLNVHPVLVLRCDDVRRSFEYLTSLFYFVTAAGGVVRNDRDEVLLIYRNGRYDLPKGHWEEGETIEECAVREVEEECGIDALELGAKICETLHAYYMKGRWELKRTHWFSMQSRFDGVLTPQVEEGIERVEWVPVSSLAEYTAESFPTIVKVVEDYVLM